MKGRVQVTGQVGQRTVRECRGQERPENRACKGGSVTRPKSSTSQTLPLMTHTRCSIPLPAVLTYDHAPHYTCEGCTACLSVKRPTVVACAKPRVHLRHILATLSGVLSRYTAFGSCCIQYVCGARWLHAPYASLRLYPAQHAGGTG